MMGMCTAESFNKYFTVAVLTAINLLNYMDRFTLAGRSVEKPSSADLCSSLSVFHYDLVSMC